MNRTILYLLAFIACAAAAPIEGNVALNAEAQEIVDAAKPLMDAKKIAKLVRIIAAQGPNSRALVASLNNINPAAQACLFSQGQVVGKKVQTKQVAPEAVEQAILDACAPYKTELETTMNAYKAALPEFTAASGSYYGDLPESVQNFAKSYAALSGEIQANHDLVKDKANFGPKVKALIDELKAIPDADRAVVGEKLPYTKEIFLPTGQYYADFNQILDYIVAKASGQDFDETDLKTKAKNLEKYVVSHAEEEFNYLNNKIDAFVVPDEIAQDGNVNKVASALGKTGARYANMLFSQPKFNAVLNSLVNGQMDPAVAMQAEVVA
uniref:Uncharacterized protein n=1 Tax=Panagrolaimus sp. ES5 TaxID=591445 RepID=A0AC34GNR5_9BILA